MILLGAILLAYEEGVSNIALLKLKVVSGNFCLIPALLFAVGDTSDLCPRTHPHDWITKDASRKH